MEAMLQKCLSGHM